MRIGDLTASQGETTTASTMVPGGTSTPTADELAYAKFLFDKQVAQEDLDLKKKEADRLSEESARSRWTNPIVVAVAGAVLVGIGNAVVTVVNGNS